MTLALDRFPTFASPFRQLDARWKLVALAPATLLCAVLQSFPAATAAFAGSLVLVGLSRLPPRWYLARLAGITLLVVLFAALLPFLLSGEGPEWPIGPVRFYWHGVRVAVLLCLKAVTILSLMLVLLATTSLNTLLKAAHALRLPSLLVQLLVLTYRYTWVLAGELSRLRVALRVRGYRNRATRHSYRTVSHVAGTLLVRGYERAERVAQAMRCRGFDGRYRSLEEFRTTRADLAFALLVLTGAVGLLLWDLAQR